MLAEHRPAAVINAAVVNGVDRIEVAPEAAYGPNALGPGLLAGACAAADVPLVHISTDYVFGAGADRPWRETDPVSPANAYGRQKAEAEARVAAAHPGACIVRVAWLFGDGTCFPSEMIRRGLETGSVAVTDQVGSPSPIFDLARRLIDLAELMKRGDPRATGVLHLAGVPAVSRADWIDVALDGLEAAGRPRPELRRLPAEPLPTAAPRPAFSALDCGKAEALFGWRLDWREETLRLAAAACAPPEARLSSDQGGGT
jgi:dTDP-4-dehydrorhamnose reductase